MILNSVYVLHRSIGIINVAYEGPNSGLKLEVFDLMLEEATHLVEKSIKRIM